MLSADIRSEFWTATRISTTRRCLRLAHYRYTLALGEPPSDVARFGSVGHEALEAGLRAVGDVDVRMAASLDACAGLADRFESARLRASIVGYWSRWGSDEWEVLAVEVEFRYMLGEIEMRGKIDAIVRNRADGRIYVVEHKFTSMDSAPGSVYWERLTIDTQISIYVDGATILGYDIAGVIYDVIAKPGHKPAMATPDDRRKYTKGKGCKHCGGSAGGKGGVKQGTGVTPGGLPCSSPECILGWVEAPRLYEGQRDTDEYPADFEARILAAIAEAPDTYYRRGTIVRLDDELPKMRTDIADTVKLARVADALEMRPRNPDACAKFGTLCGFFGICSGRDDIADLSRFPRGRAHPELAATNP